MKKMLTLTKFKLKKKLKTKKVIFVVRRHATFSLQKLESY